MPKSKLRQRYEARLAAENAQREGESDGLTAAPDVNQIDWNQIDNPFILPAGVSLYEPD